MALRHTLHFTQAGQAETYQALLADFEAYARAHPAMRRVVPLAAGQGVYKGHFQVYEFLWLWHCIPAWPRYTVHVLAYPSGGVRYYARLAPFLALRLDFSLSQNSCNQTIVSEQICIYGPTPFARVFLGILIKEHMALFGKL